MFFTKELFSLVKPHKMKFYLAVMMGLLAAVLTIGQAYFLSQIINNVFLLKQNFAKVKPLTILFAFTFVLKGIFIFFQNFLASKLVITIKRILRDELISNIINSGIVKVKSERTGEIVNTLLIGVDKLDDYFSKFLPQLYLSALIPLVIVFFVIPKDLLSALIFILTAPIIPIFMFLIGSVAEKMNKKQWVSLSRMSAYFFDVLIGIPTLKLFNRIKETLRRIEEITNIFRIKTLKVLRVAFLSALVLEIAATISVAIIAVTLGLRLLNGNFNFADALFILIIAPEFYLPLRQLGVSYHAGMEGVTAFERISLLIKTKSLEFKQVKSITNVNFDDSIIFENVSFNYSDRNKLAVDNVSFMIEKNKVTALIGQTGAGKTTIMNLLLGFIYPSSGIIKCAEYDITEIDVSIRRKKISWLPQNPHLFYTTILENIKFSKNDASLDEVINAAKKARIHDFIMSLPKGYETKVNEAGTNFSGGEIQRIALARAYLRNANLICVDEPTANLDPQTEKEIMNDMYSLFKSKTVFIIAHKLNTILKADKIIVMKAGRIVAEGNHEDLLIQSDYYKDLISELV